MAESGETLFNSPASTWTSDRPSGAPQKGKGHHSVTEASRQRRPGPRAAKLPRLRFLQHWRKDLGVGRPPPVRYFFLLLPWVLVYRWNFWRGQRDPVGRESGLHSLQNCG